MPTVEEFVQDEKKKTRNDISNNPFSGVVEKSKERDLAEKQAFELKPQASPTKELEALRLSNKTGLPRETILRDFDNIKNKVQSDEKYKDSFRYPTTRKWMMQNESNLTIGKEDIDNMGGLERMIRAAGEQNENGQYMMELKDIYETEFYGGELTKEQEDRVKVIKSIIGNSRDYKLGFFGKVIPDIAEQVPIYGEILTQGAITAAAGAATAAPIGAALGSPGGLPGAVVGAKAGAIKGGILGYKLGAATAAANMEANLAYGEYRDIKSEDGTPIDRNAARFMAAGVGIVNGSLEFVGLSLWAKTVPGLRRLTRSGLRQSMKTLTKNKAFMQYAANIGKAATGEGTTEWIQEMVQIAGKTMLQLNQDGQLEKMDTVDILKEIFSKENLAQASLAFGKGFRSGGGLSVGSATTVLASDIHKANKAVENVQVFEQMRKKASESKIVKEAPEEAGKIIDEATDSGEVFVDADYFSGYFQSKNIDPFDVADEILGEGGAGKLADAMETGGFVKVDIKNYATKLAPSQHGEFFQKHIKFREDQMTGAEGEAYINEVQKEDEKITKKEKESIGQEEKLRGDLESYLKDTGKLDSKAIESSVEVTTEMFKRFSERSGLSIDQVRKRIPLNVAVGDETTLGLDALNQEGKSVVDILNEKISIVENEVADRKPVGEFGEVSLSAEESAGIPIKKKPGVVKITDEAKANINEGLDNLIKRGLTIESLSRFADNLGLEQLKYLKSRIGRKRLAKNILYQKEGDKVPRGRIVPIKKGDPSKGFRIDLFTGADRSTFMHEMAHFGLEMMSDLAQDKKADPGLAEDFQKILDYVGAKDFASITSEQHEKFAESFEIYLKEGRAPSSDLMVAFQRFQDWLSRIYRAAKNFMNVEGDQINDEIRGVFDRMLANEEQIAEARGKVGGAPLFEDFKEAGMTDKQAKEYREALASNSQDVSDTLRERYEEGAKRDQLKWWKEEKAVVEEEVREGLEDDKGYFALSALSKGETPTGNQASPVKILKSSLLEVIDEKDLPSFKKLRVYTLKEDIGISVEEAAGIFGFKSGKDLADTLLGLEPVNDFVNRKVEQVMEQRHGPKINKAELQLEVDERFNSTKRAKIMKMELDHLVSKSFAKVKGLVKRVAIVSPSSKEYQARAEEIISKKRIRDLSPSFYQENMKRAGKKSLDALLKGDWVTAAREKRRQLQSHYLYKASQLAKKEADRNLKFLKKFENKNTRAKVGKATGGYLEEIDRILSRIGVKKISLKEADRRANLAAWVKEQQDMGNPIHVPDKLLNEAFKVDYRNLTSEAFEEIVDGVRSIYQTATLKNTLIAAGKKRAFEEARSDMINSIGENHTIKDPKTVYNPNLFHKAKDLINTVVASHKKAEFILNYLDGNKSGGVMWNSVFRPIVDAKRKKAELTQRGKDDLDKAFSVYTKKESRELYTKKIAIAEIGGATLTKQQILMVAMNTRNEYNKNAMLEGEGWSIDQLNAVLKHMTKKDWQVVEDMGNLLESYWPEVATQERELTGIVPKKVEGEAIINEHGRWSGGYTPIVFDPKRSRQHAELQEKRHVLDLYGGGYARATTEKGHTIERRATGGAPLLLDLSVISRHIDQVSHDLAYRKAVIDVNKILTDREIADAIEGVVGREEGKQLRTWLQAVATDQRGTSLGAIGGVLNYWRMGETVVNMALKGTTTLFQPLGYLISAKELGYGWALNGLKTVFARSPGGVRELYNQVTEKSVFMNERLSTNDREINDTLVRLNKSKGALREKLVSKMFLPIGVMDMVISLPTWMGAYNKAISGSVENIASLDEKAAIDYADHVVRTTQGDGAVENLAGVQRGNELARAFTMFYSYMSVQLNQFFKANRQFGIDYKKVGVRAAIPYANAILLTQILPELMTQLLTDRLEEEEKEEIGKYVLKTAITSPLKGFVGVRDAVSTWEFGQKTGRVVDYIPTPLARTVKNGIQTVFTASQIIGDEKDLDGITRYEAKAMANFVGAVTHLPSAQVFITSEYFWAWMNGDENPDNAGELLYRGLVTGRERKNKKKKKRKK